jgi:transcriptional regulator with XRE-family HTH domain
LGPNKLLKQQRELRNWTQQKVALAIGTTAINVSRWERGLTFPGPYFRQRLCELFEKSPVELGLLRERNVGVEALGTVEPAPGVVQGLVAVYDPAVPVGMAGAEELVGRAGLLEQLRLRICATRGAFALNGLPGVGKTALAAALVQDPSLQEHFRDGVLWAGLGQRSAPAEQLARWGRLLGLPQETTAAGGLEQLARALRDAIGLRRMLLVIDDAWSLEDALACKVGGPHCTYLLTTRCPELAYLFARGNLFTVGELTEEESLLLLQRYLPELPAAETGCLEELARAAGGLPLALTLMGRHLQLQQHSGQPRRLRSALERLRDPRERLLLEEARPPIESSPALPGNRPLSLLATIEVSELRLSARARQALRVLALFPARPNSFSEEAALAVAASEPDTLDELFRAGLLESGAPNRYTLHRVIADYARLQSSGDEALRSQTIRRMLHFFVTWAGRLSPERDAALLALERENVLTALELARRGGLHRELLQAAAALAPLLTQWGQESAARLFREQLQEPVRARQEHGDLAEVRLHLGGVAPHQEDCASADYLHADSSAV